tara:strand:+ start:1693 stop:3615 length:1923 start_codon:yes stop_codon:yes gene_type:complete
VKKLLITFTLLLSSYCYSNFIYESNQSLIDLRNESSVTNLSSGDDQTSAMFPIGFNFSFYGETFNSARMATNGCLHFLSNGTTCNDYTPDPLPYATYTMYPFWTDLISGTMKAKAFNDKTVFGWYDKKEYNRTSSNSFEVILWHNSSFEYRYGELNINKHDVLIGHQGNTLETYQYLFHDECSTGSTNVSGVCVTTDWNNTLFNSTLENGGSLYSDQVVSGGYVDPCIDNPLYSNVCAGYWEAYDDEQCDLDPQYAPFCAGYRFEQDVGYFVFEEEFDYGISQEINMGYEEPLDIFYNDVYTIDDRQNIFVQEDYFEHEEILFTTVFEEPLPFELHPIPEIVPFEELLQVQIYDEIIIREIIETQEEMFMPFQELEEFFEEERVAEEELIEEEIYQEEEIFDMVEPEREERLVEQEELIVEETFEVQPVIEKSSVRVSALSVVSSTINTAKNSISGTDSGNSIHASGNTVNSGGVSSIGFDGGLNFSNSIGSLEQFDSSSIASSESLSTETISSVSIAVTTNEQVETNLDTSIAANTNSEADSIADEILAKNIATAQEESIEEQKNTGQYGEEDTLISFINYNPAFNNYKKIFIPNKYEWYAVKSIYIGNSLEDNNLAFYKLSSDSLNSLSKLKELQPNL